jgi:CheY-like chemotaxis protein
MEKVLVVDDEECMRDMVGVVVSDLGYDVVKAADGQEALDRIEASDEPFALVVMDICMPRMDGVEAAHRIRRMNPSIKIVLISGNDTLPAAVDADAFLPKPFRIKELCEVIRAVHEEGQFASVRRGGAASKGA